MFVTEITPRESCHWYMKSGEKHTLCTNRHRRSRYFCRGHGYLRFHVHLHRQHGIDKLQKDSGLRFLQLILESSSPFGTLQNNRVSLVIWKGVRFVRGQFLESTNTRWNRLNDGRKGQAVEHSIQKRTDPIAYTRACNSHRKEWILCRRKSEIKIPFCEKEKRRKTRICSKKKERERERKRKRKREGRANG